MSVGSGYYAAGIYRQIKIGTDSIEVAVCWVPDGNLIVEQPMISAKAKAYLRCVCHSDKIALIVDKAGQRWIRIGGDTPDLTQALLGYAEQKIYYYLLKTKSCTKKHEHSSKCVRSYYPCRDA